mmetsp:Transcript_1506/g.4142  ORF Transcript_1506/g.4142 Transcript_1506/m.4142 type:complete len:326 (+) Transcript_1506:404-1381(+)
MRGSCTIRFRAAAPPVCLCSCSFRASARSSSIKWRCTSSSTKAWASSCACSSCASARFSASSACRLRISSATLASASATLASASASSVGMGRWPQGKLAQGTSSRKAGASARKVTVTKRMRAEYVFRTPLPCMLTRNCRRPCQSCSRSTMAAKGSSPTEALPEVVVRAVTASRISWKPAVASSPRVPVGSHGNFQPKLSKMALPLARRSRMAMCFGNAADSSTGSSAGRGDSACAAPSRTSPATGSSVAESSASASSATSWARTSEISSASCSPSSASTTRLRTPSSARAKASQGGRARRMRRHSLTCSLAALFCTPRSNTNTKE